MDASTLRQTLSGPLDAVLDKHRADIIRLAGTSGTASHTALSNDETVRTIAEYCHELLPWPLRVAVKKPIFVDYVLRNREPVLARLSGSTAAAGAKPG